MYNRIMNINTYHNHEYALTPFRSLKYICFSLVERVGGGGAMNSVCRHIILKKYVEFSDERKKALSELNIIMDASERVDSDCLSCPLSVFLIRAVIYCP